MDSYMHRFEERLAKYIPSKETWTPADEALFGPRDLFRIPLDEAEEMRFKALRHAFGWHYNGNETYRVFCTEKGV